MPDELLIAVLAAGASRRLGRPKQLVHLDGEPLVRRACRTAIEAAIGPVVVVLGCKHEMIAPVVADLNCKIRVNDEWEEGLASSVRAATVAAREVEVSGLLLLHADQYAITAHDLIRLRDAWRASPGSAFLSRAGEHLGPPAVLPSKVFSRMVTLVGDKGPRSILGGETPIVEFSLPAALKDVDRPSDLPPSAG